jgi:catechol 2,3-dioxygenase-like lactoylglutathione lyase family enzyme
MSPVTVRYIVDDVDAAVAFYDEHLGFEVERRPAPGFAMLSREGVGLLLSDPRGPGGAAQPMPDGRRPEPGGWNRIRIEVDDLPGRVAELRGAGVVLRGDIVHGRGGDQVLIDDPAGNPVELFQSNPQT